MGYSNGFIANNTGSANNSENTLRRNIFNGNDYGARFQGVNRSAAQDFGSRYTCNTFNEDSSPANENERDIREIPVGTAPNQGVPNQGSLQFDPRNTFTQNAASFDDIYNTTPTHFYFRQNFSSEPDDNDINANVDIELAQGQINCDPVIEFVELTGNEGNQRMVAEGSYQGIKALYEMVLDDGNTDALVNMVESTNYTNALQTYYDLMAKSPDLSEETLQRVLHEYSLPNALSALILAANPHAAKSDYLKAEMEAKLVPYNEYQLETINQGLSIISSLEAMRSNMAQHLGERNKVVERQLQAVMLDETITDKAAAQMALLDEEAYLSDARTVAGLLWDLGQQEQAITLLDDWAEGLHQRILPDEKQELKQVVSIMQIQQAISTGEDVASYETALIDLYTNGHAWPAGEALALLLEHTEFEYYEPIPEDEAPELRSKETFGKSEKDALNCYPNPASNMMTVSYDMPQAHYIRITDAMGKLITEQYLAAEAKQLTFDITDWSAGLYSVHLYNAENRLLKETSFIKE